MGEVVRRAKSEYREVDGPLGLVLESAWAIRSERLMVLKRKRMHMVRTLALATNDADLRSWSKVALRLRWAGWSGWFHRRPRRKERRGLSERAHCPCRRFVRDLRGRYC